MGFLSPKTPDAPVAPPPPPPPPAFGMIQGQKPGRKSMAPTFLGAEASPASGQQSNKTLLGQ